MEKYISAILLSIINDEGNIKRLKHYGLTYRQIGELIEANVSNGNLNDSEEVISLTDKGREYLSINKKFIKERDKAKWIEPDLKSKMQPIDKESIFLPSRSGLSFLK